MAIATMFVPLQLLNCWLLVAYLPHLLPLWCSQAAADVEQLQQKILQLLIRFGMVSASDPDCGVNAIVNYTLGDSIKQLAEFEVRSATGEVCIANELDYEKRNSYEFPVIATDRGGLSTIARVKIQLTDVNDNRPIFYPREYNVSLRETASASASAAPIVAVVATDADSGRFGAVTYRIVAGNEAGIFRIDRATGEIFINRPNMLSVRTQAMHVLNISASDGGGLRTSTDAFVFLSIIDATQRPPIFEKPRYSYQVKEDVPHGTVVGSVMATSSDAANRNGVRYSIYSGDPDSYFNIDTVTGNIRIANPLDHETKPQILLNIQAMSGDPPAYGHTQVNIDVEDVNDNAPEFETNLVRISVPENVDLDIPLYAAHAHDKDSGKSGEITYTLHMLSADHHQSIKQQQQYIGNASIATQVQSSRPTLNTFAGTPTGALAMRNRMAGAGTSAYAAGIASLSNSPLAAAVTGISTAVNHMTGVVAGQNLFAIDARSGHLTLSRHLDYETMQRHALIVTATDGGEPPLSSNLTILVEVQDVNDNAPMFERSEYSVKVLESLPINSQILQVTAIDLDTGNNARITYRLVSSNNTQGLNSAGKLPTPTLLHPSGAGFGATKQTLSAADAELAQLFGIFPNSGWLYLRGPLDRESRDSYELTVMASDNGTPAAHARARVIVEVLDANDNDPRFLSAAYEFVIEENMRRGALVGVVGASDLDLDENAEIRYSLIPSNTSFQVNSVTGEITTREPLDRELRAVYDLVAEARDQGTPYRSARVPVKVHITDVNDNAPDMVDPQEDVVSVREEQPPGTEVVRIRAVDRDNGQNASITYSILKGRDSDGYGLFSIDAATGVIRTRVVLDHEDRSIYRLAVAAKDGGNPPMQSIRLLRVEVLDLNDNRPTFTSSSLVFRVPEDVSVGYVVGSVSPNERAVQHNMIDSNNDLFVTYTLSSLVKDMIEGAFDIDRHTGSLVVARQLDRETQSEFRLEIRALDTSASNNPQSSAITVKVEIADVNDNPPRWLSDPIELQVSEATDVGTIVYNFSATDADSGSNSYLQYKLLSYTPMDSVASEDSSEQKSAERKDAELLFSVDALTGALTLLAPLDYESTQSYILIVEALDQSSNVSSRLHTKVTAVLQVTDVNDNAPQFVSPAASSILAEQRFNTPTAATIRINDALRIGETVAHIVAIDQDAGANGDITYAIVSGNEAGHFRINAKTGYIDLAKLLPPTALSGPGEMSDTANSQKNHYNLVVSASDNGTPTARQSQLKLQISVHGTSSNPPRFHQSVYYANISENAAAGTFVLQVAAKSFNGGDNGNLSYEIPAGVADNHFHVDRQRGIVTTRGQFDRETKARYTIPIYVYDTKNAATTATAATSASTTTIATTPSSTAAPPSGAEAGASLAATATASSGQFDIATIIITISDVNDHAPEFRPGACYALSVPENNNLAVIHTVVATDLDEGANGEIVYSIIGGNIGNKFSIDMHSGELTALPLDREQHSRYLLQIQAQDHGTPNNYHGQCNITVVVEDENDNNPQFEKTKYVASIAENAAIGASVLRIKATDADLGINARLVYSLANETQWLFAIDSKTGTITTAGPLDRERQYVYNFFVVATDGGRYNARSASVPVQIVVDDVNDNRPVFERYPFRAQVPALIQPGQMLLQVGATDVDVGMNGEVLYSLGNNADEATRNKFRINPNTGVVSTTQSLASESGRLLHIEVVARDKGNPARTAFGLIELRVGDVAIGTPVLRFQNDTYRLKFRENMTTGMRMLQVSAVRSDGRRQQIYYSIGAGNEDGALTINATTGEIKVGNTAYLDYERYVGTALDGIPTGGSSPYRGRAMFYDDNEKLGATLENATSPGEQSLSDNQRPLRNQRELQISDVNEHKQSSSSALQSHELRLVLVARTDATPLLYGYAELIIELEDENDNSPHFTQSQYSTTVWEGNNKGTFVVQVQAFDADEGANARILYHIVDGNHDNAFVIEPAFSGIVKTNIVLDREIRDMYKLKVIATDEGVPQMTGTATIRVHIVDVNDNQPTFPPHSAISVSEGTELGTVITTVSANDVDTYPSLTYQFGADLPDTQQLMRKSLFALDRYSGKVTLKRHLDYEDQQEYQLEIIASDNAHEVRTILTVRVTDENDNAPIFEAQLPPAYAATLPDQQVISSSVAITDIELVTVNATDADAEGRNSEVRYSIHPSLRGFSINELTGAVFVNMTRLGSVANDIYVMITAQDSGLLPLKSSTVLRVRASKCNSARVQFLQTQYRAQINEAAPLGTVLLHLSQDVLNAHAERAAGTLLFKIVSGNEDAAFEVYQSSSIVLVKTLDRERNDLYKLRLVVSDAHASSQQLVAQAADNSSTAINVFVTVEDANDNAPKFAAIGKYEAEVSELAPLRHSIAQLLATDADLENTPYSEVVYDITSGNDEGMFTIDLVSGVLFVNNKLDFDTGAMCYALVIRACDSALEPLCSLQSFRLTLRDENDNAPHFPVTEYIEFVGENEPVGSSVFTARATDLDRGVYGRLNYTIDQEAVGLDDVSWKLFRVDPQTGIVTSNAVFDYEQRHRYDFVLRVTDSGGKSARVKVRIEIESKDEYAPQFTERTYRFVMPSPSTRYLPLGYVVGQVSATDRDNGPDGRIVYQLSSQHAYFKVNRTTGAVITKKKLDDNFDDGRDISLVIAAGSGRQGSLTNMTVVEISLDPLAKPGTNLASSGGTVGGSSGVADWLVGLIIVLLLVLCAVAGIFLFIRMRSRKPRNVAKPHLSTETVGVSNSYVDPSAFDTIPIRNAVNAGLAGSSNSGGVASAAAGQFPPPKYDEIPPYGAHAASSNSGAATTSELSGSEQSGSSGRGSAEDDGEDEEIRMINEGPLHHRNGAAGGNGEDGRISDISVQNTQEYLARLGIVDREASTNVTASNSSHRCSDGMGGLQKETHLHHPLQMHMYDEDPATQSDITNLIYAKLNDVAGAVSDRASSVDEATASSSNVGAVVDRVINFTNVPVGHVPNVGHATNVGPHMNGSLSSIVHSEEELTGSYNWDYLLDWGPQYQPLAHVFSEIARLKDDNMSVHSGNSGASSSAKSKQSQAHSIGTVKTHIPPPLLTNVAPRAINMAVLSGAGVGVRLPPSAQHHIATTSLGAPATAGQVNAGQYMAPRSPISHDTTGGFSTTTAMSPSFSPSLSPLATRSPSISPLGGVTTGHHLVSLPRHAPQPKQRGKTALLVEQEMRVRM
ncbi:protein dachsous [Anastrepha ludens]|uniref:protein dachsous n=1 Tax=Anastrepha ludens TaxID=28586 RepID=UPI0023B04E15|nr:protein dachsous [Anastrepha ludens]